MISIMPMAPEDAATLLALEDGSFAGLIWTEAMLRDELDRQDRRWWVAFAHEESVDPEDGTLVGAIGLWLAPDAVHVLGISVASPYRRQGVGSRLVKLATNECGLVPLRGLTLEVSESNTTGIAFYRSLGFSSQGVRPGYYPDGSGAVIMTLEFEGSE